jgi:hypothetical protein
LGLHLGSIAPQSVRECSRSGFPSGTFPPDPLPSIRDCAFVAISGFLTKLYAIPNCIHILLYVPDENHTITPSINY